MALAVDLTRIPIYLVFEGTAILDEYILIPSLVISAILGVYLGKLWLTKWKQSNIRIGILVAMVAQDSGGRVIISEVNPFRLKIAQKLGFQTINPKQIDLIEAIKKETNHKGADVVFEVSGSQTGVDVMTECAATRGRIVMVAIHAEKPVVDMFRFFWRELELIGVRVYEKEDYEKAIKILESGGIDANTIITDVNNLD